MVLSECIDRKIQQTFTQSRKNLSPYDAFLKNKIPKLCSSLNELNELIKTSPVIELPTNAFNKTNLLNSNYADINFRDFEKFLYICKANPTGLSSKQIMSNIINDTNTIYPILIKGSNNIYWSFSNDTVLCAYKVLGICPQCKIIDIDVSLI